MSTVSSAVLHIEAPCLYLTAAGDLNVPQSLKQSLNTKEDMSDGDLVDCIVSALGRRGLHCTNPELGLCCCTPNWTMSLYKSPFTAREKRHGHFQKANTTKATSSLLISSRARLVSLHIGDCLAHTSSIYTLQETHSHHHWLLSCRILTTGSTIPLARHSTSTPFTYLSSIRLPSCSMNRVSSKAICQVRNVVSVIVGRSTILVLAEIHLD